MLDLCLTYEILYRAAVDVGAPVCEALLWHGTRGACPRSIAVSADGLDSRVGSRDKCLYGRGLYFADQPMYSCHFGHVVEEADAASGVSQPTTTTATPAVAGGSGQAAGKCRQLHRTTVQMLLCRVQLGACKEYGTSVEPTLRKAPEGFHSVSGLSDNAGGTKMWTVYNNAQCYTAYVVTFSLVVPCAVLPAGVPCGCNAA